MQEKSIYVVILNYNNIDNLIETIDSFTAQSYSNLHIIISDNNSSDSSIQHVKTNYPEIKVIENKENLGWAGGNNIGIKYALSNNADYILLSNNDISISDRNLILNLYKTIEGSDAKSNVKIIGPKVNYYYSKEVTHNEGWNMYPKENLKGKCFNMFRKKCEVDVPKHLSIVDSADGSFFLIKSDLFGKIGLLDEHLFMYADEIEFCYRAWEAGNVTLIDKRLTIFHKIGASSIIDSSFSMYYRTRNMYYFLQKHSSSIRLNRYFLYINHLSMIKNMIRILFSRKKLPENRFSITYSILRGFIDGRILNRMGKRT